MILDGFGCILVEVNPAYFVSGVGGAGGREEEEEWEEEGGLGFGEGEGCHFGTLSLQTREEIGRFFFIINFLFSYIFIHFIRLIYFNPFPPLSLTINIII